MHTIQVPYDTTLSRSAEGSLQMREAAGQSVLQGLTESRSSMTRWGLVAEDGLVPLSLLNCVNRMFMVARRTSERLCLIYREKQLDEGKGPSPQR